MPGRPERAGPASVRPSLTRTVYDGRVGSGKET